MPNKSAPYGASRGVRIKTAELTSDQSNRGQSVTSSAFCCSKLWMLLVIMIVCSASSLDSKTGHKKVEGNKMKTEQPANLNNRHVEAAEASGDTGPGASRELNSVDILTQPKDAKEANGRSNNNADKGFESLDEAKQFEQFNEYNKLHKEPPIGDATMDDAGTIKVRIRSMGGMNVSGGIEYEKGSEHYESVLKHLGGMKPGDCKLVPPWPDEQKPKK